MKIAFDAQLLIKGEKTGIGWCAENILMQFAKDDSLTKQINCFSMTYTEEQKENIYKYGKKGYEVKDCKWFHSTLYRLLWNFIPIPYHLFFGKNADITVFFNYSIPPGVKGKKIVFVHDMSYKTYAETVRQRTKKFLEMSLQNSCNRADQIITISEFSKTEIQRYLSVDPEKIKVLPLGVDLEHFHPYDSNKINAIKKKYGLPEEYLLYLGTIEPRKNIKRLIEAYAEIKNTDAMTPKLILAGKKGWLYEEIFQTVNELKLDETIKFLGYVESEDIPVMLSGAKIFLFPSLYEGFGLPPLEAMACGVPVLTSNTSALPEVVGNAAKKIDPLNKESIKEGISDLLNNKEERERLARAGIYRAQRYSWNHVAEQLKKICEDVYKEK